MQLRSALWSSFLTPPSTVTAVITFTCAQGWLRPITCAQGWLGPITCAQARLGPIACAWGQLGPIISESLQLLPVDVMCSGRA